MGYSLAAQGAQLNPPKPVSPSRGYERAQCQRKELTDAQVEHAIQRTPELDIDKGVLHAGEDGESSLIGAIMKK